jgi:hypothetical protein
MPQVLARLANTPDLPGVTVEELEELAVVGVLSAGAKRDLRGE